MQTVDRKMNNSTNIMDIKSKNQSPKKSGALLFRWLLGGVVGGGCSLVAIGITLVKGPILFFGLICLGQYGLYRNIVPSLTKSFTYNDIVMQYLLHVILSLIMYSISWGIIGALLASGRKKQIIVGVVLLILYASIGYWSLITYGSRMMPT